MANSGAAIAGTDKSNAEAARRVPQLPRATTDEASSVDPVAALQIETNPEKLPWRRAALLGFVIVAWFLVNLTTNATRLLDFSPDLRVGAEAASSLARLFGALVLFLIPDDQSKPRLRWIAGGFIVLGIGGLVFGYLPPIVHRELSSNTAVYLSRYVWTVAGIRFLIGLIPRDPPPIAPRSLTVMLAATFGLVALVLWLPFHLPTMVHPSNLSEQAARHHLILEGLTPWHWVVSLVPFALALIAIAAIARGKSEVALGGRLLIAMILFAGAQLHDMPWPSAYGPVLTSSDVLELVFAGVVVVAGIIELHRVGDERAMLLAREQEYSRSLRDLAALKSDFTAMIAHELGNPLSAIRRYADLISRGHLEVEQREQALLAIQREAKLMTELVIDVQESARIERADFDVELRPCAIEQLIDDAAAYARTLPGEHQLTVVGTTGRVRADPDRIGQVLRNLLNNAAKYSRSGSRIELLAIPESGHIRIEVSDDGPGIDPDEIEQIFGKFKRGRGTSVSHGLGLGLYVARRIVIAHGGDLMVRRREGSGSIFAFSLERA
jgi:signal transduction histidine kinase